MRTCPRALLSIGLLLAIGLPSPASPQDAAAIAAPEPVTRTIAGSGRWGTADGPAATATFMEPAGITTARDGRTIYVTDASGNAVRRISAGTVDTVAGATDGTAGYVDGPAAAARFHRPVGVACGPDGTLYVADSLNHRIRKIKDGVVSTFAGSGADGNTDGAATAAAFHLPKGIAVAGDGTLYVADYGVGLRKITPNGTVSTLGNAQGIFSTPMVYAVDARGSGSSLILAYTDDQGIHIVVNGHHQGLPFGAEVEPYSESNSVGHAFGVAIVGPGMVIISDLWTNRIRFVNFNDPPFRPAPKVRTLAGGSHRDATELGGFADGPVDVSLVKAPYGVAVAPSGAILVADTGNRRVREIDGFNPRLPILSSLDNLSFPPKTYRIALVGDSFTWNDILWPESIGGVIEAGLGALGTRAGQPAKASVDILSASGGTLQSATDFITNDLGDGEADLVILVYDKLALAHELQNDPTLNAGDRWKTVLPARVVKLAASLAAKGTKFALLPIPVATDVSPVEISEAREESTSVATYDAPANFASGMAFENAFAVNGLHVIRLLQHLADADRQLDSPLLYNVRDDHLSIKGSILVGQSALADLLQWKPWQK